MEVNYIDINADAGESFGRWVLGRDEELLPLVTTVNVACGFHAGDPVNMRRSLLLARQAGVSVGAHPGYPDLLGFGRRRLEVSEPEVVDYIVYQTGALRAMASTEGITLTHVKPHGSLYGQVVNSADLALEVARQLQSVQPGISLMIADGSGARAVQEAELPIVLDAAVDLEYDDDGRNIIESVPGAKDPAVVAERALGMVRGYVVSTSGKKVPLRTQSLCVHGDRPNAPEVARAVHRTLEAEGIEVRPIFGGSARGASVRRA